MHPQRRRRRDGPAEGGSARHARVDRGVGRSRRRLGGPWRVERVLAEAIGDLSSSAPGRRQEPCIGRSASKPESRAQRREVSAATGRSTSVCRSRGFSTTISSIRSSSVTIPSTFPYSSATSAICRPPFRSISRSGSSSRVAGTTTGSAITSEIGVWLRTSAATPIACLMCTTPTNRSAS